MIRTCDPLIRSQAKLKWNAFTQSPKTLESNVYLVFKTGKRVAEIWYSFDVADGKCVVGTLLAH